MGAFAPSVSDVPNRLRSFVRLALASFLNNVVMGSRWPRTMRYRKAKAEPRASALA